MIKSFVYGTLRKGIYNYDLYLKGKNTFKCNAYIKGSLKTIKGKVYPAFLPEGSNLIIGELHEVDDKLAKQLDELECYYGKDDPRNEYNRELLDIYNQDGEIIDQAYVYIFNMDNPENKDIIGEEIECHDYVEHTKINNLF
ncbi:gamma-glutamylcyclotransferase [uncultured Thomasclavelia sp.]|uniref:gamma-glutamylcyclotransferase family protein n=1 Tax=uncultured Thomasclavelia sp. TaxID=3025759 RepID=UPI0025F69CC7|nr:gamma-glutamylcyclotransferase family protein [uncultured Thomasclavelia sp.]